MADIESLDCAPFIGHLKALVMSEFSDLGLVGFVSSSRSIRIVNDLKFTVTHAVEPMEKGLTRFNEKLHKISQNIKKHEKDRRRIKDDSVIGSSSPSRRVICGIDDPLLNGTVSDSSVSKGRRHRRKSCYNSADSGGENSSDHSFWWI
ncbi:hypothetical protein KFK09_010086 [Dendrobium nobile]|uniref:Uncharacterized protein n=1 Tax=Dendrobium nobile TaxID=94219 RepID=A0A8T3BL69_DENNO|nr:hypothetical protein KFK09_010086 [Dendrobium nobile]